jgi:hypothetical protein
MSSARTPTFASTSPLWSYEVCIISSLCLPYEISFRSNFSCGYSSINFVSEWIYMPCNFEFLSAVMVKIKALWNLMPCRLANSYRLFGEAQCLWLQTSAIREEMTWSAWPGRWEHYAETSVIICWSTQHAHYWRHGFKTSLSHTRESFGA